jgi:SecD/SecF fusion protein
VNHANVLRAVLAVTILALSAVFVLAKPPRLGLDLRGGTQITLETRGTATVQADRESTEQASEVLRRRVDALGVAEPSITQSGDRRIIVELPGVHDPKQAAAVLGRTAQLTFHPVRGVSATPPPASQDSPAHQRGGLVLADESGQPLRLGPAALTGAAVAGAQAQIDPQTGGGWFVSIDFRGSGQQTWAQLTGRAACVPPGDPGRRVAIVLDDEIISSPQVDPQVACDVGIDGGSTQITGRFTPEEARDLALLIRGGALPVPVGIIEQRTVGPTLGQAAIAASAWAAIIGVIFTGLFIVAVYRLLGGIAVVALTGYGLISYALLLALGATLTLPGLAGFVLAIGMAVDANVLVFERAREEYAAGRKSLRSALAAGFRNALSAIADSNITTLLAAGLLFFLASGPVRGFGVTLSIGVVASMISALIVTRVLAEWAVNRRVVRRHPQVTGMASLGRVRTWLTKRNPDLMRHGRRWLALSVLAVVLAVAGIAIGGLNLGVEFTGGRLMEYSTSRPVAPDQARAALADLGFPRAVVQSSGNGDLTVRTGDVSNTQETEIRDAMAGLGGQTEKVRDELIGPSLGDELRQKALIALGVALAAQLLYLSIRFRWTFGAAAVLAMAHDVIILVGTFAWLGKPVDGVFLAALLTVIGYSVNDTVVVFDRVRERWAAAAGKMPFPRVINQAVLQTLPRTVNTGLGAVFILSALAVLGGDSLTDFAVALLIGIAVGTYSSMFTASPIAIELQARSGAPPPRDRRRGSSSGLHGQHTEVPPRRTTKRGQPR